VLELFTRAVRKVCAQGQHSFH